MVHRTAHADGSRTCGTDMVEERYPLHVVQKTLGHLDARATPQYVELAEDQLWHELESHRRD